jgi:hypothetical protein
MGYRLASYYWLIGSQEKTYHEIDFDLHEVINGEISKLVFRQFDLFFRALSTSH